MSLSQKSFEDMTLQEYIASRNYSVQVKDGEEFLKTFFVLDKDMNKTYFPRLGKREINLARYKFATLESIEFLFEGITPSEEWFQKLAKSDDLFVKVCFQIAHTQFGPPLTTNLAAEINKREPLVKEKEPVKEKKEPVDDAMISLKVTDGKEHLQTFELINNSIGIYADTELNISSIQYATFDAFKFLIDGVRLLYDGEDYTLPQKTFEYDAVYKHPLFNQTSDGLREWLQELEEKDIVFLYGCLNIAWYFEYEALQGIFGAALAVELRNEYNRTEHERKEILRYVNY